MDPTPGDPPEPVSGPPAVQSNADIADRLASLAQMLAAQKENPYKVRAYRQAAAKIRTMSESLDELVRQGADLTAYAAIGERIAGTIREIVTSGKLDRLERLRSEASPELASITDYPRLDHRRVLRAYRKLGISSIEALRDKLSSGEVARVLGASMAEHLRQGLNQTHALLLSRAEELCAAVRQFLLETGRARRVEVAGDYRRRVEVIEELAFVVEADDFPALIAAVQRFGGRTPLIDAGSDHATFSLPAGIRLRIDLATEAEWGISLVVRTGSTAHVQQLLALSRDRTGIGAGGQSLRTEAAVYATLGLAYVEPELREGRDELDRAAEGTLPILVAAGDIRGELHAHSTSSDGADSIEQMALAARDRGYEYIGITDHSQSLRLARGLSTDDLWRQIRLIDQLNDRLDGIRILKSAEVDILADGSLDYPDELLRELDYTVCSIHSRFGLSRTEQTERVLRAMDHPEFNIMGHPTGRLLLRRPGYSIDLDRVMAHAAQNGCFFEINSSPARLDLPADACRRAVAAGVMIAVSTDAHRTRELAGVRWGIDQARRAGLERASVLNTLPWPDLARRLER